MDIGANREGRLAAYKVPSNLSSAGQAVVTLGRLIQQVSAKPKHLGFRKALKGFIFGDSKHMGGLRLALGEIAYADLLIEVSQLLQWANFPESTQYPGLLPEKIEEHTKRIARDKQVESDDSRKKFVEEAMEKGAGKAHR